LCAMAGTAGAATTHSTPAPHRAAGTANWPMFRGDLTHSGVSPETAINTTNAGTLTAGWTASVGTAAYSSPAVVSLKAHGSGPVIYEGTVPTGVPGFMYAIYGPGNTHGSCVKDWSFDGWTITDTGTWSSPAYATNANGTPVVVFGSDDPDNSVYALNAKTG